MAAKVAQGMAAKVAQGMAAKVAQGMASEITQEVEPNYSYSDEDEDSSEEANQPDVYFKVPDQTCLLQAPTRHAYFKVKHGPTRQSPSSAAS